MSEAIIQSGSTGQARRDRLTQTTLQRLTSRLPLLRVNPGALTQLVQIVFGALREIRTSGEDRTAELCERGLDAAAGKEDQGGCRVCSWEQKAFCEECGTDFARTQSRAALPLFIPAFADHRLHVDLCMLCSDACVDALVSKREALEQAAAAGATISARDLAGTRLTRSATDPHLSAGSFLFHAVCYGLLLYTLHLGDYALDTVLYYLTAWMLLAGLLFHGLWLLNILFSWSAGGGVSNVYRLRQTLSLLFATTFVLTTGTTLLYWTLLLFHPAGIKTPGRLDDSFLVEHMKHTMPMAMMAVELVRFPHVKIVSAPRHWHAWRGQPQRRTTVW